MAWIWDLSERRVLEPVDEQCLLAEDFDTTIGGRQPAGQDKQQAGCRPADRDVGFAVAIGDGDAGRCTRDQPLAGAGQPGVGGVKMQALAVSAQVLRLRAGRAGGAGGDAGEPFAYAVRGNLRGQMIRASSAVQPRNPVKKRPPPGAGIGVLLTARTGKYSRTRTCTLPRTGYSTSAGSHT